MKRAQLLKLIGGRGATSGFWIEAGVIVARTEKRERSAVRESNIPVRLIKSLRDTVLEAHGNEEMPTKVNRSHCRPIFPVDWKTRGEAYEFSGPTKT